MEGNDKPIIVVTGCGSSGTKYMTKFFKRGGVFIGHEIIGPDGISSWYLVPSFTGNRLYPPTTKPPFKGITFYSIAEHFGQRGLNPVILHQTRYPLKVISTFQRANQKTWNFVAEILNIKAPVWRKKRETKEQDDYCLWCCMYYWLKWNMMTEEITDITYRIEDIEDVFDQIVKLVKRPELIEYKDHMLDESKLINSRKSMYTLRTWDDLFALDETLTKDIIELGIKYGYEIKI